MKILPRKYEYLTNKMYLVVRKLYKGKAHYLQVAYQTPDPVDYIICM